jgi:flagellar basal body-associated protein FliL
MHCCKGFITDINRGNDNLYACQGGLGAAATAIIVVLGVIIIALIVAVVAIVVFFFFARGKVFKRVEYDSI